jgi:hypothetical protein
MVFFAVMAESAMSDAQPFPRFAVEIEAIESRLDFDTAWDGCEIEGAAASPKARMPC